MDPGMVPLQGAVALKQAMHVAHSAWLSEKAKMLQMHILPHTPTHTHAYSMNGIIIARENGSENGGVPEVVREKKPLRNFTHRFLH